MRARSIVSGKKMLNCRTVMIEEVASVGLEVGENRASSRAPESQGRIRVVRRFHHAEEEIRNRWNRATGPEIVVSGGAERTGYTTRGNPVELWNVQSHTQPRIGFVFHNSAGEMRVTKSAIEREPFSESQLILREMR